MAKRKKTILPPFAPAGAQVTEAFPRDAVLKALEEALQQRCSNAEFEEFFAERLSTYRDAIEGMEALLPPTKARTVLAALEVRIEELRPLLRLAASELNADCIVRNAVLFEELLEPLDAGLYEVEVIAGLARERSGGKLGKLGPRSTVYRDGLLHDVAAWLRERAGLRKGDAAGVAAAILRAVDVPAPEDKREAEKLINSAAKKLRENFTGMGVNPPADRDPTAD